MLRESGNEYLKITKLSKTVGATKVLHELDLTIMQGEFVAIVGRSGCGKSTLLRLISGLEEPSTGTVELQGRPIRGINSNIRFLFQEPRLLPWKKVIDNVKLGIANRDDRLAEKALQDVGLKERAGQWPSILSGGQKQRVSLARALASEPKLMLLDEPLGALDALTRIEMQQLIERLWLERKFTALLVTHDVSEAVAIADRVIFIDQGKIAMDIEIQLARPRQRDNNFAYFEKQILDRVMGKVDDTAISTMQKNEYVI